MAMTSTEPLLPPGFRFHPTDEELILHYLKNRASSLPCPVHVIADLDLYKFDPWDLPSRAVFGDKEWYFFTPRDRKYPNGVRPNRAAGSGYWKATGTDKPISTSAATMSGRRTSIGVKKALVFYVGRPPRGTKTNWIMHEYRLAGPHAAQRPARMTPEHSMRLDDWVLCRIYKKNNGPSTDIPQSSGCSPMEVISTAPIPVIAPQTSTTPDARDTGNYSTMARLSHDINIASGDDAADLYSMMMAGCPSGAHRQTSHATEMEGYLERRRRVVEGHSYISPQGTTAAYMQMLMGGHLDGTGEEK